MSDINKLGEKYWDEFLNQTFPGFKKDMASDINELDWMVVMFNQKDPSLFVETYHIQNLCNASPNSSCIESMIQMTLNNQSLKDFVNLRFII